MIQIFTTNGTDDIVVERASAVDVAAPCRTGMLTPTPKLLVGLQAPGDDAFGRVRKSELSC